MRIIMRLQLIFTACKHNASIKLMQLNNHITVKYVAYAHFNHNKQTYEHLAAIKSLLWLLEKIKIDIYLMFDIFLYKIVWFTDTSMSVKAYFIWKASV